MLLCCATLCCGTRYALPGGTEAFLYRHRKTRVDERQPQQRDDDGAGEQVRRPRGVLRVCVHML